MGPFLPVLFSPVSYPTPPPASGPSLEAITLGWGGHQAVLGLGTKVGGSFILGRDVWSWGLDQLGEGTGSRGAHIGELAALGLGVS